MDGVDTRTASAPPPDLAALTRQVARLKRLVAAALALAVTTLVIAATPVVQDAVRDRIDAREFAVRDEAGNVRAKLNEVGLSLYDTAGQERMQAVMIDGTTSLILYGRNQNRIALAAADDGHLGLYFFDNQVRDRARLSLNTDGDVGFTLFDDNYVWRATIAVTSENEPSLTIFDKRGHVVSRLPPEAEAAAPSASATTPHAPSSGSR